MERAVWKQILCSKYHYDPSSWLSSFNGQSRISRVWMDVLSVSLANPNLFNFFQSNVCISLGNGVRCSFWRDKWLGDVSLQVAFPRLFSLSLKKEG